MLAGEAHQGDVEATQILQGNRPKATVEPSDRITQRECVLREEGLRPGHVEAAVRARDEPIDADDRRMNVILATVGEHESTGLQAPEPGVLELAARLCCRDGWKRRGDRRSDRQ